MPRRFFSAVDVAADLLELTGREAHHLQRVLRMQPGELVWLFDGRGQEVLARICSLDPHAVRLEVTERRPAVQPTALPVTLATGVPKGDRFRWLIEKVTELGVQRVIPLITQRSIVDPGQGKLDKLRQTIVEACKQCGRSQLMELTEPLSWRDCLTDEFPGREVWIAHPGGETLTWPKSVMEASREGAGDTSDLAGADDGGLRHVTHPPLFLIGPEGGFTESEVAEAVAAGARPMNLGPRILRIETAAVAIAALTSMQR